MADENTPIEFPPHEVPREAHVPPAAPPAPVQAAPPPAASLVVNGTKNEREIELEQKLTAAEQARRDAEFLAAEKERENEELRRVHRPREPKPKRAKHWSDPVFSDDE